MVAPAVHTNRRSDVLEFADAQRLFQLEGELSEHPPGSEDRRRYALAQLGRLVDAPVGVASFVRDLNGPLPILEGTIDGGWSTERARETFLSYRDTGQHAYADPSLVAVARCFVGPTQTFVREDLLEDRTWYASPHVQELRRLGDVDDHIYAVHQSPGCRVADCFAFHRPWGARRFNAYERRLVDFFQRESRELRRPRPLTSQLLDELPTRLRQTFEGVRRGLGEKEIAAELGVSPHTVHDYVKTLYRRFTVKSRAGLLARFVASAEQDAPSRRED